jgi:hypothetical protein
MPRTNNKEFAATQIDYKFRVKELNVYKYYALCYKLF